MCETFKENENMRKLRCNHMYCESEKEEWLSENKKCLL